MKTYKLKQNTSLHNYGGTDSHKEIWWAFCSKPNSEGVVKQISRISYCRESLCNRVFDTMANPVCLSPSRRVLTDKVRLVATIGLRKCISRGVRASQIKAFSKSMSAALHMLNVIEKEHGWVLTKMHGIRMWDSLDIGKMIIASPRWMKSPHILSLFTLICRISQSKSFHAPSFKRTTTYKGVMSKIKKYSRSASEDSKYVARTLEYWDPIFKNLNKLFHKMSIKDTFRSHDYNYSNGQGLEMLCSAGTGNRKIDERFERIIMRRAG